MGQLNDLFIGIAGLIGAGKTTLAEALGEHLGIPVYYEPVADNAYLADFYRDTAKYAFATQIYLLNRRFQQHQEIIWRGGGGVQDRTIYEDAVFAKTLVDQGLMEQRDYQTYLDLFRHMSNFMCRPNLIVYLDLTPETSMERVRMRNRNVESGIRQGITSVVTGNCGHGPAPAPCKDLAKGNTLGFNEAWGLDFTWDSFEEYVETLLTPGIAMNAAPLVVETDDLVSECALVFNLSSSAGGWRDGVPCFGEVNKPLSAFSAFSSQRNQ